MTSERLNRNWDQPTLFAVDSLAKTSAPLANRLASNKARGRVSFTNSSESFAWFDPNTSSWKTLQRSLITDWTLFSENWPRQGSMRNGHVFRQVLWEPAINVTDGGLLPTPTACIANDGETPSTWLDRRERVKLTAKNGNGMGMPLTIAAQMLPTPVARDYKGPGRADQLPTVLTPTGMNMYLNPSFVEEMMGFPVGWTV